MAGRVEPWLRGTLTEMDAIRRQVLHALELTAEDVEQWCARLTDEEVNARLFGVAPVAFHLRHIARSLDRLLTYAAGLRLSEPQMEALRLELQPGALTFDLLEEVNAGLTEAAARIRLIPPDSFSESRFVGRDKLTTTVGGLLVHCAEHTQRHAGQAITTAKIVVGMRTQGTESHEIRLSDGSVDAADEAAL